MKKLLSLLLASACIFSLAACGSSNIEASKKPFPAFEGVDFDGNTVNNDLFADYDATIINFWTNGCGSCIAEMPDLEKYYQEFKEKNINLVAVAASAGDSEEMLMLIQSKREVQSIMSNYVGIVRSNLSLKRAMRRLSILFEETEELYNKTKPNRELCELRNMIAVAYLVIKQGREIKESVGCHYNIDYPKQ